LPSINLMTKSFVIRMPFCTGAAGAASAGIPPPTPPSACRRSIPKISPHSRLRASINAISRFSIQGAYSHFASASHCRNVRAFTMPVHRDRSHLLAVGSVHGAHLRLEPSLGTRDLHRRQTFAENGRLRTRFAPRYIDGQ
jgi:hypothetical protein